MIDYKKAHMFAVKWYSLFAKKGIDYDKIMKDNLIEEGKEVGFNIEFVHSFINKYGNSTISNPDALYKIIETIDDVLLLGSAILYNWRYFSHWSNNKEEILHEENKEWFVIALERLAYLTREKRDLFTGEIKTLKLHANALSWVEPAEDEEVYQDLVIDRDGSVSLVTKTLDKKVIRDIKTNISKDGVDNIFYVVEELINDDPAITITDTATWELEIINSKGESYKYEGMMLEEYHDISNIFRDAINIDDLLLFDNNYKPEVIKKITIDYESIMKVKPKFVPEGEKSEYLEIQHLEQLIIDRDKEEITHIEILGSGYKITKTYHIEDGVIDLLDSFDQDELFSYVKGNPDGAINNPNVSKNYKITVDYKYKESLILEGSYDKLALPSDYPEFIDRVHSYINSFGVGEMFEPNVYSKTKRLPGDLIFVSVIFSEYSRAYYYLCDDDSIEIGDFVLVPAGSKDEEKVVKVVDIEYYNINNTPIPLNRTKKVIRKCSEDDLEYFSDES